MKTLVLIRHAKSSWNAPLDDKKRTLEQTGIEAIKHVAQASKHLVSNQFTIWSSTAVRAATTAKLYCESSGLDQNKIIFNDQLYTFNEKELEDQIKKSDNSIEKLILFGHNEAITNFVNKFGNQTVLNVPTSGFVQLEFETSQWKDIKNGKTINTIFPKEID